MPGGWIDRQNLDKGENGRNLCRWCNLEVPKGRFTFCSDFCVEEWKLRTDPGFLRERVLARDKGTCVACGTDCLAAFRHIKKLRGAARTKALIDWGLKANARQSLWDADHIIPVVEGGGECDLSNLRTLCLKCHRLVTAQLRQRRTKP
jgi:5-methylcytosine-specific restriction protein A